MKKKILMSSLALLSVCVLAFFLVRANQIIQRQQRVIRDLSAKAESLERAPAAAANSAAGDGDLWNLSPPNFAPYQPSSETTDDNLKAEVDQLRHSLAALQIQLAEVQQKSGLYPPGGIGQNGAGANNLKIEGMPNGAMAPYSRPTRPSSEVPPGWIPFEFNGATYYRVPLAFAK